MQVIGKHFDEAAILRTAFAFEENTDFHTRQPEGIVMYENPDGVMIGLEVHVQLNKLKTKVFCGCTTDTITILRTHMYVLFALAFPDRFLS